MDWKKIREEYKSMTTAVATAFGGATATMQQRIFEGLKSRFAAKIKEGKVKPGLDPNGATVKEKERLAKKGTIQSQAVLAPLYRTGKMADSLMIMEQTPTSLVIGSDSKVSPHWHDDHRPDNVPQRIVLDDDEVLEVIDDVVGEFLANLSLGGA